MAKYSTQERAAILELYERSLVDTRDLQEARRLVAERFGRCPHTMTLEKWRLQRSQPIDRAVPWHRWLYTPEVALVGFLSAALAIVLAVLQAVIPGLSPASKAEILTLEQQIGKLDTEVARARSESRNESQRRIEYESQSIRLQEDSRRYQLQAQQAQAESAALQELNTIRDLANQAIQEWLALPSDGSLSRSTRPMMDALTAVQNMVPPDGRDRPAPVELFGILVLQKDQFVDLALDTAALLSPLGVGGAGDLCAALAASEARFYRAVAGETRADFVLAAALLQQLMNTAYTWSDKCARDSKTREYFGVIEKVTACNERIRGLKEHLGETRDLEISWERNVVVRDADSQDALLTMVSLPNRVEIVRQSAQFVEDLASGNRNYLVGVQLRDLTSQQTVDRYAVLSPSERNELLEVRIAEPSWAAGAVLVWTFGSN